MRLFSLFVIDRVGLNDLVYFFFADKDGTISIVYHRACSCQRHEEKKVPAHLRSHRHIAKADIAIFPAYHDMHKKPACQLFAFQNKWVALSHAINGSI